MNLATSSVRPVLFVLTGFLALVAGSANAQKIETVEKVVGVFVGAATAGQAISYAKSHLDGDLGSPDTFGFAYGAYGAIEYKKYAGEVGYIGRTDQLLGATRKTNITRHILYVAGLLDLPFEYKKKPKITTFAKGGLARWSAKSSDPSVFPLHASGIDPLVGIGAKIQLKKKIDIRAEALMVLATPSGLSDRQQYFLLSGQYSW